VLLRRRKLVVVVRAESRVDPAPAKKDARSAESKILTKVKHQ
jgi:hypothetical protein